MELTLGLLYDWEYDERFIKLLDKKLIEAGKSSYIVGFYNLEETVIKVLKGHLKFKFVLDRASDTTKSFKSLVSLLERDGSRFINEPYKVNRANNKATMHLEFLTAGINVPYTIVLSPSDRVEKSALSPIGIPFVIKPAEGGGGYGVVLGAGTLYDVIKAREKHSNGLILIQEEIVPKIYENKPCWFRVFYACGKILPCFWDPKTHRYSKLSEEEKRVFSSLFEIASKIYNVSGLNFFSTEIALTRDERFVVVDYVNDQCDMRFQSDADDGVPDEIIDEIAESIVNFV
ncbi:MAG: ATP-grasp domain-containing protein [bacterium]